MYLFITVDKLKFTEQPVSSFGLLNQVNHHVHQVDATWGEGRVKTKRDQRKKEMEAVDDSS